MTGLFAWISLTALSQTYFICSTYFTRSFSNWNVSVCCYNLQNIFQPFVFFPVIVTDFYSEYDIKYQQLFASVVCMLVLFGDVGPQITSLLMQRSEWNWSTRLRLTLVVTNPEHKGHLSSGKTRTWLVYPITNWDIQYRLTPNITLTRQVLAIILSKCKFI